MPRKFGQDRHKPPGEWVQTTMVEDVVGIPYRRGAARAFAKAVAKAERVGLAYGLRLEPEPENPVDPRRPLKWSGSPERRRWFSGAQIQQWHVGYLDAELAAELHEHLLSQGVEIAGELYSVYVAGRYIDIKLIVLAPPGHSHRARTERHPPEGDHIANVVANVKALKRDSRLDEATNILLAECNRQEADAVKHGWGVAPWYYEQLAIIYRKMGRFSDEVEILERYARQPKAPGAAPSKLAERLERARLRKR